MSVGSVRGGVPAGHAETALAGDAGVDALGKIVRDPMRYGLAELLGPTLTSSAGHSLRLVRSKYKPGKKLVGYYLLHCWGADRDHHARRDIAVTWAVDGHVQLQVSPEDPVMPQLQMLTEPSSVGQLVEAMSERGTPAGRPQVTTLRYRPGQRHVLQARYPAGPAVYVKVDRDASGSRAVPVAQFLQQQFGSWQAAALVAEPIGFSVHAQAALWWEAPGRALGSVLRGERRAVVAEQVGRAVRVIHDIPRQTGVRRPQIAALPHSVEAEAASTLRAGEHIAALLPRVGLTYANVVSEVVEDLDRLPADEATFTHGDLKADNLLLEGERLRILDLDRFAWTEPALDLGKFLADLRWWSRAPRAAAALEAAFRSGYGDCDPVRWARAGLVARLFQVKFAARRRAVHDPTWVTDVRRLVAAARSSTPAGGL